MNPILVMWTLILCLWGCHSTGETLDTDDLPSANVEAGDVVIESAFPEGCVATVEELPDSHVYSRDDPALHGERLIVVLKSTRRLMLFTDGSIRYDRPGGPDCWRIALGAYSDGRSSGDFDKSVEGDRHTPIGLFRVSDKPWSSFYGAMLIHYPDTRHAQQAYNAGRVNKSVVNEVASAELAGIAPPQSTPLGGNILIHGGGSWRDWTWGCIALDDADIDDLRALLPNGMKTWILILP